MITSRSSRTSNEFGDLEIVDDMAFGDRKRRGRKGKRKASLYGLFGDIKRKLKRPYKKSVVRSGRKLVGHHKIGKVAPGGRGKFRYVTRKGGVYEASVSKGRKAAARKPAKKAAKKAAKKK